MAVATQWNASKPAMGNQVSNDVPDIEENFEEIQRILQCITNGTLGTTNSDEYEVDVIAAGAAGAQPKGLVVRPNFVKKDADELYIPAGLYHHAGTVEQLVYWDTKLEYLFSNLAAGDWCHLYLDDTAIVTLGTNLLTKDQFIDSVTAPAWSESKHGWYNGDDRWIFAVYHSSITEFIMDGDTVWWADGVETHAASDIDTVFTDIGALRIPDPARIGIVHFIVTAQNWYWRTNGQTGAVGHFLGGQNSRTMAGVEVITDSSWLIEIKAAGAGAETIACTTDGWKMPVGS